MLSFMIRLGNGLPSSAAPAPRPPNYVNPPTHPPVVQVICILIGVLTTLSLALRLCTRGRIKRQFDVDDIFATIATLLADTTFVIQIIVTVVFRGDRHIWDIPPKSLYTSQKLEFVYNIIFSQAACQSKLSLLFFTRKMVEPASFGVFYPHYICLITLMVIVALCQVLFVIVSCVECSPLKASWDPRPTYPHKCFNTNVFLLVTGIINTLTDFLCTVLPASIVLKLQMPLRKRIGVASLFLVGIFVNVASALRIYYRVYEAKAGDTWDSLPATICSNVELGLGLLCVNLPVIHPLITHYYRNPPFGYVQNTRNGGTNIITKSDPNAYVRSQCSDLFFSVGDDDGYNRFSTPPVSSAASADGASTTHHSCSELSISLHDWNGFGSSIRTDKFRVPSRVAHPRSVAIPWEFVSREYGRRNRSDEISLQR